MDAVVEKVANDNARVRFLIGTIFLISKFFERFFATLLKAMCNCTMAHFTIHLGANMNNLSIYFILKLNKLLSILLDYKILQS